MFDIGLVSVSFRPLEPNVIVDLCRKHGLPYVEWGSDVHAPCADKARLHEIVKLQKEYCITCSSYGTYFRIGVNDTCDLNAYIDAAKLLGTDTLRLWCGDKNYTDMTEAEREFMISESIKAARIAEESGVTLCMECHNKTFTNCIEGALSLMDAVDSKHFQMYWQPNQFRSPEENLDYAERIAKYVKVIHIFNWEGKNKYPLADAVEIWRQYLEFFDGTQKLLLEFMPDGKPESLGAETEALREIKSIFERY